MKGKLIVFEGADGSGKTSTIDALMPLLENHGFSVKRIYFSSLLRKRTILRRAFSLFGKLLLAYFSLITGKLILADRYIYLTFRKNEILKKIVRTLYPRADKVFVMKASPKVLRKRREIYEGIGNKLLKRKAELQSIKEINELYRIYESVPKAIVINMEKPRKSNLNIIINEIKQL